MILISVSDKLNEKALWEISFALEIIQKNASIYTLKTRNLQIKTMKNKAILLIYKYLNLF